VNFANHTSDVMRKDEALFELIRHPLRLRLLEVIRTESLGPRMRRITVGGPELEGFVSLAPEDHVKVFFPRPGEAIPIVPSFGPMGLVLPKLGPKPDGRDYTPLRFDAVAQELDIDFFLHGGGIGASWASRAVAGEVLGIAGPRGSHVLKREFAWQLFVGDETALPEMAYRIAQLPKACRALGVFLVQDGHNELGAAFGPNVDIRWVHRRTTNDASAALVSAVRAIRLPTEDGFAWVAGEASEVRAVYRHLLGDRLLMASRIRISGHWKRGIIAHDHHEAIAE
jgi:NADPH-dependent ferric siderophore reductase